MPIPTVIYFIQVFARSSKYRFITFHELIFTLLPSVSSLKRMGKCGVTKNQGLTPSSLLGCRNNSSIASFVTPCLTREV